jgi:hypothetical protein
MEEPHGKSPNVTPSSTGGVWDRKSSLFVCRLSSGLIVVVDRQDTFGFCARLVELLRVRRLFAGGAAVCGGCEACDTRCERSHSKVQLFFVFSQLPHEASGP